MTCKSTLIVNRDCFPPSGSRFCAMPQGQMWKSKTTSDLAPDSQLTRWHDRNGGVHLELRR